MDKKIILGFAIGVIAASGVAYVATKPPRYVARTAAVASAAVSPVDQSTSTQPSEQSPSSEVPATNDPANAPVAPPSSSSDDATPSTPPAAVRTHSQVPPAAAESPRNSKPRLKSFAEYQAEARQTPVAQASVDQNPRPQEQAAPVTTAPNAVSSAQTAPTQTAPSSPSEWHRLSASNSSAPEAPPPAPVVTVIPKTQPQGSDGARVRLGDQAPRDQVAILRPERSPDVTVSSAARQPGTVTLTAGTQLSVRLAEALASDRNRAGDNFFASLDRPLVIDGMVVAERGARVEGRVADAKTAGHASGAAQLSIELTKLHASDGQIVPIRTAPYAKQGPDPTKDTVEKVGGGAVLGAIIGAIAGGGKGAAIGAGVGGAAGGGTVAMTRGKPVVLPVETLLTFRVEQPVTITEQLRN